MPPMPGSPAGIGASLTGMSHTSDSVVSSICATDAAGSIGERLTKDYARLLESMDKRR